MDWEDENAPVADHFRVHEVLWLPSWRLYHDPSDTEKAEAAKIAVANGQDPKARCGADRRSLLDPSHQGQCA